MTLASAITRRVFDIEFPTRRWSLLINLATHLLPNFAKQARTAR
jgi:hypothetical protein